ncbi:uncharacterized protein CCOS01_03283 [Colletotrichum costaricense]|uniref:Uncharacterized protein n=1 Tax=Colletotrichum costaricense TaxID=1209916 RepID=A0AAJ0E533_9PEZI|nr:uncharacterized protein CCOS01_03283 [Colletotrichum costaricense]KAK1534531.1 hypothetical protein CCOS01_03283 [Colletotrichum costaricense]
MMWMNTGKRQCEAWGGAQPSNCPPAPPTFGCLTARKAADHHPYMTSNQTALVAIDGLISPPATREDFTILSLSDTHF